MARNGSGSYSLAAGNPVVTGTTISSTVHNNTNTDLETAMTNSLAKNGETVLTGALDFNGQKLILDADGDTSITSDTDDIIDIEVAGTDALKIGWQKVADTGFITLDPAAVTADTTENTSRVHIGNSNAITIPAGTTARAVGLNVEEPNITATGTVTAAATVRIGGAPTEGSSNYALWIDDGRFQLDDTMQSGVAEAFGAITAATTVAGVGLASVSSSGTGIFELVFDVAADTTAEQVVLVNTDGTSAFSHTSTHDSTTQTTIRSWVDDGLGGSLFNNYPMMVARFLYT